MAKLILVLALLGSYFTGLELFYGRAQSELSSVQTLYTSAVATADQISSVQN